MERNHQEAAPVAVSPESAAHLTSLGRTKIFQLIREGELPVAKVGRRTLIPVAALHALVERMTTRGAA